jgi:hypothetical protein
MMGIKKSSFDADSKEGQITLVTKCTYKSYKPKCVEKLTTVMEFREVCSDH